MKYHLFLTICFFYFVKIQSEYLDDTIESQILRELSVEGKKCLKTAGEIIFILDGSTSVGPNNFNKEKDFATQIVDKLVIGVNMTRVALITYNSFPLLVFNLEKYNNSKDINREILKAEFTEGITVVGDALNMVLTDIEPKTRKSTGKVIILISDGKRNGGMDPILVAKQLKASNYLILTIGLDKETDESSMIAISGKKEFFLIKNFDALPQIVNTIVLKTCTEFHVSKCPQPTQQRGPCVNKQEVVTVTTYYFLNGNCVPEQRRLTLGCLKENECPDARYVKTSCAASNFSFILFHNYTRRNGVCAQTTENLKKVACGCPKSEESMVKVVIGKDCIDGFKKRMLRYYEFNQFKCSETYLNLSPIKCKLLCNGTSLISTPCRNGKRNNTLYMKVFSNNTCTLKAVKTTQSNCISDCPKSIIIESKRCVNNQKDVYHITFEKVKEKCIKHTKKIRTTNCTADINCPHPKVSTTPCINGSRGVLKISSKLVNGKCQEVVEKVGSQNCTLTKCPRSTYRIEPCKTNEKQTSLIRTFYRNINGACVKKEVEFKKLSCKCAHNNRNISVIIGKQCQNGFRSRYIELSEERNSKCEKVTFTLRRIRCKRQCKRNIKIVVGKCKSNVRIVKVLRVVEERGKCVWKVLRSKNVKCQHVCPSSRDRKSRCIRGKQAVLRVTFKEVGDECKFQVARLNITNCKGCPRSTFRIEPCKPHANQTSLIRSFYTEINGACVKKEVEFKKLSCKCAHNNRNISVIIGKQCQNGFRSRYIELSEERNSKCEKVTFTLRRIRCKRQCKRNIKIVVGKCKSNVRIVKVLRVVGEHNKCVWKVLRSKNVKCQHVCPSSRDRKSRCIRGKQAVLRVTFKEVGDECKYNTTQVNVTSCKGCPRSTYRVDKCEKGSQNTFLVRTFYREERNICVKKETKVKSIPCKCYDNITRNLTVTFGNTCIGGFRTRMLAIVVERNQKCVIENFYLRRMHCKNDCNKTETKYEECKNKKRIVIVQKQVEKDGKCTWVIVSSTLANCTNTCPQPTVSTTSCVNGQKYLVRTTYQSDGMACKQNVEKVKLMTCEKCLRKSVYEVTSCSANTKKADLIRISHRNCTRKIEKLKEIDCSCESLNSEGINITAVADCKDGFRWKTLSYYDRVNGKCVKIDLPVKGGKCQCSGSVFNISVCVNGNRSIETFSKYQSGTQCLLTSVSVKKLHCKSVCPTRSVVLTRKCVNNRQLKVLRIYEQNRFQCTPIKYVFQWTKCITTISGVNCKTNSTLKLSACHNGNASVIYTRYVKENNKCVEISNPIAEIACTGKCERSLKPNLVAGKCIDKKQLLFFILSKPQGNKCLHKVTYLGNINCKNC